MNSILRKSGLAFGLAVAAALPARAEFVPFIDKELSKDYSEAKAKFDQAPRRTPPPAADAGESRRQAAPGTFLRRFVRDKNDDFLTKVGKGLASPVMGPVAGIVDAAGSGSDDVVQSDLPGPLIGFLGIMGIFLGLAAGAVAGVYGLLTGGLPKAFVDYRFKLSGS